MCGIAGIYNRHGAGPDRETLERMAHAIAHRGPDGERFFVEGGLGFAHRHLRIIDLSDAALQPMSNEDGTIWVILNGEIYNYIELRPELEARGHVFSSHSDTETILHAYEEWGVDCLERFNGMFAFALWDSRTQRLFVARDRLGVKPLYYVQSGDLFAFASEIKALLQHPAVTIQPDLPAIAEYMNAMYTVGEHTWFKGIKRLLPGHFILIDPDDFSVRRWWDLPAEEHELGRFSESYLIERTRELLDDSVRLRLRSDVPLGAHLSGGIDSSAIVALYSRQLAPSGEPVRTFSGAFTEGAAYDERRYIRDVVSMYHPDHHEVLPVADDLPHLLDHMIWHMDEPAAGPGLLLQYKVCELTRRSGVTVINGGQGGDEEWAGYFGYIPAYLRTVARQAIHHPALLAELAEDAAILALRRPTREALVRALATGRSGRLQATRAAGPWAGPRMRDGVGDVVSGTEISGESAAHRTALGAVTYRDLKWYLPALLQVEDRMSMAYSLESRAPLLDYRLVEHAAQVPSALKMKGLKMKHVLREAVNDLLPESVYGRNDKMGMPTPISPWFRGSLASWVRSELTSTPVLTEDILSEGYVHSTLDEHLSGGRDRSIDLWKMLNLASWWRVYVEGREASSERPASESSSYVR